MADTNFLELVLHLVTTPFYIIGFIGNVLVVRIVHKTPAMHTTTNYLLANLAVSDVTYILLAPLRSFASLPGYLSDGFGKFACKFLFLTDISIGVSSFTLTVLAVERYHALLKPFRTGSRLNEDNIKRVVPLIWISSAVICLPILSFQEWSETYSICTGPLDLPMDQASKVYAIIRFVLQGYIPMAVMVYCYGSLIKGLYFSNTICASDTIEDRRSEKKKLVITFVMATTGFVIGYAPIIFVYTALISGHDEQIELYNILLFVSVLVYDCSLCLNPILYAFRSSNFKEGFKRIVFCRGPTPSNEIELR